MYAIVDIAGQQFRVEKNQKIFVHRLEGESGSKVDIDKVLLIDNDQNVVIGEPVINGAMVYASIIEHKKGDKVLVFKKKRKKGYRKLNGHRQYLTQILIEDIIEKGAKARIAEEKPKAVKTKKTVQEVMKPEKEAIAPEIVVSEKPASEKPKEKQKTTAAPGKKTTKAAIADESGEKVAEKKQPSAKKAGSTKKTATTGKSQKTAKPAAKKVAGSKKAK
jgi:large subunit ribosomal protein L21